jgi:hypothetical protein
MFDATDDSIAGDFTAADTTAEIKRQSPCGPDSCDEDSAAAAADRTTIDSLQQTAAGSCLGPADSAGGDEADRLSPLADSSATTLEVIGGHRVHPMASMFPLIEGQEFEDFVGSILNAGRISEPVEFHEGLLICGRNRLRAVEVLRCRGFDIETPAVEWRPRGYETVEEHIYATNVHRRHLTDDQRAALATKMLPQIRAARAAKQAATRFGSGALVTADGNSCPPETAIFQSRSRSEKAASSSVGQLAALANVSRHKAEQATILADGVARGEIPEETLFAVVSGKCRLRDACPDRKKSSRLRPASACGVWPEVETVFEDESEVVIDAAFEPTNYLPATPEVIQHRWESLKTSFAEEDHDQVRAVIAEIVAAEQRDAARRA